MVLLYLIFSNQHDVLERLHKETVSDAIPHV